MSARTSSKGNINSLRVASDIHKIDDAARHELQQSLGIGRDGANSGPPRNASDDQNFRSAYYKKIGFHGVEVKHSLEQVMVRTERIYFLLPCKRVDTFSAFAVFSLSHSLTRTRALARILPLIAPPPHIMHARPRMWSTRRSWPRFACGSTFLPRIELGPGCICWEASHPSGQWHRSSDSSRSNSLPTCATLPCLSHHRLLHH